MCILIDFGYWETYDQGTVSRLSWLRIVDTDLDAMISEKNSHCYKF